MKTQSTLGRSSKRNPSIHLAVTEIVARVSWRSGSMVESLEERVFLSHVPTATPDFLLYHNHGSSHPYASTSVVGLTAAKVRTAYGIDSVSFNGVVGNGAGQTIAIIDAYDAPNIAADLHAFDLAMGLSDPSLTVIKQTGTGLDPSGAGNSWALETSLDVEWAHAVAPGANIVLFEAKSASYTDLFAAIDSARNYAGVSVISMSWGGSETSTIASTYNSHFTTPAGHTPITFFASSGDNGAYNSGGTTKAVGYPSVSANVVSVGGTRLAVDSAGNYISESGWGSGTSSGSSGGSGGGISKYAVKPSWQSSVTQSATFRTVPDVAFLADPFSGAAVYDSYDSPSGPWLQIGGTSLAAPMWAGVMAIVDQGRVLNGLQPLDGPTQTLPMLYSLSSSDFHDITTGNNGFAAGPGYDLVTGRGTPIVNLLALDMAGYSTTPTPTPTPTPTIGGFTVNPSSTTVGTPVTLSATGVTESGGSISGVAFYRESNGTAGLQVGSDTLITGATQSGTTWSTTAITSSLVAGTYTYYAQATDTTSQTVTSSAGLVLTTPVTTPVNDALASATVLTGSTVTATGSNVNATKQTGEPSHAGNAGGKSIWYSWTAPAAGKVTINTAGSSFDTLLAIYTGTAVGSLKTIASNDDATGVTTSATTFTAVKGTTYRIAVDGYGGASGGVQLYLSLPVAPANDKFASAVVLTGTTATWSGSNVSATRETGEPKILNNAGGASVWLTWTAPTTRTVTLNTAGSSFDTMLAVYTGSSVSGLTLVASNDDASGVLTSSLTFNATAGVTYRFAVDGYSGKTGSIILNLL